LYPPSVLVILYCKYLYVLKVFTKSFIIISYLYVPFDSFLTVKVLLLLHPGVIPFPSILPSVSVNTIFKSALLTEIFFPSPIICAVKYASVTLSTTISKLATTNIVCFFCINIYSFHYITKNG